MNKCNITKDLIPLYVEGLTNEDSTAYVERHLNECPDCHSFHAMIKQDYEKHVHTSKATEPKSKSLEELVTKLATYQHRIKVIGVLVAMLLSCIITGAGVQFLSTLPLLIIAPFICRLYYHRSLPILLSIVPFGILGGMLSENDVSFIPFFTLVALLTAGTGIGAAALLKLGLKQFQMGLKLIYMISAVALILMSSLAYFSFWGNPIGYVEATVKSRSYVQENYEPGTLQFKGVSYNFKDHRHYGRYEYVLNGVRQQASIGVSRDGHIQDDYKYILEMQFSAERGDDLKVEIAAAIDFAPFTVVSIPQAELNVSKDELNHRYYHLSYDMDRRNQATEIRRSEGSKISYEISFGSFIDELDVLNKEQFIKQAKAIQQALQARHFPYHSVQIKALDSQNYIQTVHFTNQSTEEQLLNSYDATR